MKLSLNSTTWVLAGAAAIAANLLSAQTLTPSPCSGVTDKTDEWNFDPQIMGDGGLMTSSMALGAPGAAMSMGLATGGAKDINNFRAQIENDLLPQAADLTYEGLFYDYFFDLPAQGQCQELICPSFFHLQSKNPMSLEDESYLTLSLSSGLSASDLQRKPLNLVVVMDISGSMSAAFDEFYYDKFGVKHLSADPRAAKKTKMEIANRALVEMLKQLKDEDRLAIVLFDNASYLAKPFNYVCKTDMTALAQHVLDLEPMGGTNFEAGYGEGRKSFSQLNLAEMNAAQFENRIIFLTDAMPNTGATSDQELLGMIAKASEASVYTSFVGIGLDFNNDLIEKITKTEGANYTSVYNEDMFVKQMKDDFDNLVNPVAFDVSLQIAGDSAPIEAIYGTPDLDLSTQQLVYVRTLFPAASSATGSKGGVIVLKMKQDGSRVDEEVKFLLSYKNRSGVSKQAEFVAKLKGQDDSQNPSVRKAVLLSRYGNLLSDWIIYERAQHAIDDDLLAPFELSYASNESYLPILPPIDFKLGEWEQKSVKLSVASDYQPAMAAMLRHFELETKIIGDKELEKEQVLLKVLSEK